MASSLNVSAVDSNLYSKIFGDDAMREIMCDAAFERRMVEAEKELAQVQADLGQIPEQAAQDIVNDCDAEKLNRPQLQQQTELVGLPVWGLVRQLNEMVTNKTSAAYLHGGLNTHDIMDLGRALQIKDAHDLITTRLDAVRGLLVQLSRKYRDTPMVARTHLQHALPSTFGYRTSIWLTSLDRHAERLKEIKPRLLLAQIGGASGSLASLGEDNSDEEPEALKLIKALSLKLGLYPTTIPWHATRDGLAEAVSLLALIGGSLAKIALDIVLLQVPEVGEVAEPFVPHRGASSTMPHKNNPVLSEAVLALGKMLRQEAGLALDAVPSDFERAGSGAWQLEWAAVPQSFTYCSAALKHTEEILAGLRVDEQRMKHNLGLSRGLVAAEHVVVALYEKYGRTRSHDIVYDCCRKAALNNQDLSSVLKERTEVTEYLTDAQIDWHCDPANYLGMTKRFIDMTLAGRS